ncbi:MAG: PadR family transcriptional regulator [Gemmatimonadales bacterium]
MRPHHFYILMSLAGRDRHGSAIMRDVLDLTGGDVRLWPVTLYGSLDELIDEGLLREVAASAEDAAEGPGGHKRWFRITAAGKRVLAHELKSMGELVRRGERRLSAREAT